MGEGGAASRSQQHAYTTLLKAVSNLTQSFMGANN
jgi:hypothetical protein